MRACPKRQREWLLAGGIGWEAKAVNGLDRIRKGFDWGRTFFLSRLTEEAVSNLTSCLAAEVTCS